jgi:hypothetical protein
MKVAHRVRAQNLAVESTNKIHDDEVARRYGFAGGLVPGVDVYAYVTHAVVERFGSGWLSDGSIHVRLLRPVYDHGWITVEDDQDATDATTVTFVVRDEQRVDCAVATASIGAGDRPDAKTYPRTAVPSVRPRASTESLRPGVPLGSVDTVFEAARAAEYLDAISETRPEYAAAGTAHPGWLLRRANRVLAANVALGPWIHVESDVRLYGTVGDGEPVSTRARVQRVWEHREHRFVTLDVLVLAYDERPVMQAEHTAIYEPRVAR